MIVPLANQKDVNEIPEQFKKELNFVYVENVDEVFAVAFDKKTIKKPSTGAKGGKKGKFPRVAQGAA